MRDEVAVVHLLFSRIRELELLWVDVDIPVFQLGLSDLVEARNLFLRTAFDFEVLRLEADEKLNFLH